MPSFDVVCKLDLQEVDNAINQTLKEVGQRFDFKGTPTEVTREEHAIQLRSADDFKVRALADILREKLARRQVPLRALAEQPIEPGPARLREAAVRPAAGHRDREGAGDRQAHQGSEAEGPGRDPGRPGSRVGQEARRSPGRR